ncbi:MAG: hypothetical protein ACMV1D_01865, partial [Macromonas sp.]
PQCSSQARTRRDLQRLWRVLSGRALPAGGVVVTSSSRCLHGLALERRAATLLVWRTGGAVAGTVGTALDCRWPGLRCHPER